MGSAQDKGDQFEKDVELILTLKGYKVSRDQLINGTQVDLVAQKEDPLNNTVLIVECTDRNKKIGIEPVKIKSALVFTLQRNSQFIYRLLFVSKKGFTKQAKAFEANNPAITLLDFNELENLLIDFMPYVNWYLYNFENSIGIFKEGKLFNNYIELSARTDYNKLVPSIAKEVDGWLKDKENNLLFILGEYGSGKTSFCRYYVYRSIVRKYVDKLVDKNFTPLLINLRENRNFNIRQLVTDTLINQYGMELASFMAFEHICYSGRIIMVLDGFDEMVDKSDRETIFESFKQILMIMLGAC